MVCIFFDLFCESVEHSDVGIQTFALRTDVKLSFSSLADVFYINTTSAVPETQTESSQPL